MSDPNELTGIAIVFLTVAVVLIFALGGDLPTLGRSVASLLG